MDTRKFQDLRRAFDVLEPQDQRKLAGIVLVQVLLGIFDLAGVFMIGLLGAVSVSNITGNSEPNGKLGVLLDLIPANFEFNTVVYLLVILSSLFLVGRTVISVVFTRRILFFLSRRGAGISASLISRLFSKSLLVINSNTTQKMIYSLTSGVELITIQVLATGTIIIADFSLLLILMVGLFLINPINALGVLILFSAIIFFLYRFMHIRASILGNRRSQVVIASNEKIMEALSSYRELVVRNRRDFYAREIGKLRFLLADTSAEINFLPYVSKYVIETSIVVSALMIGVAQFIFSDTNHAVPTLAIFMAAGTRIAPALLRIQQGTIAIKSALGEAKPTLDLITSLERELVIPNTDDSLHRVHPGFVPEISVTNLCFRYPDSSQNAISAINLHIPPGSTVAFVGPSGGGKTTLIDLLLGILKPESGEVLISGLEPLIAIAKWPGAISYVPQDVVIIGGSIRENVALGYPLELAADNLVLEALRMAQLRVFVEKLDKRIDAPVGERGTKLSGGERQRLGIARAMFTNPNLLVLDEATSSLDISTEVGISEAIQRLKGSATVLMIAHRLSTVKSADLVVYLDRGKVLAAGTFEEVRLKVPSFNSEAEMLGI